MAKKKSNKKDKTPQLSKEQLVREAAAKAIADSKQKKRKVKPAEGEEAIEQPAQTKSKKSKIEKKTDNSDDDNSDQNSDDEEDPLEKTAREQALEYLNEWEAQDSWKFKKVRQTWLLQNATDKKKLDKKSFVIFLKYLQGLQGMSKTKTVSDCREIVTEYEQLGDPTGDERVEQNMKRKRLKSKNRRALKILKVLA